MNELLIYVSDKTTQRVITYTWASIANLGDNLLDHLELLNAIEEEP